ncbi:MAG: CvpA family protein [Alistipes sp.]|nr:CvpA family protein [Alistipes sp.]
MIIDILFAVLAILSLILGWRKGFVVQLIQLIVLYAAILLAPELADSVGEIFTNDRSLTYLIGFVAIILVSWVVIRIIAPLFRKILLFGLLKKFDSLFGMVLSFFTMVIIVSVVCSLFVTANIGQMRADKVMELGAQGIDADTMEEYVEMFEDKDLRVRDFFEPNYVSYEVLDDSLLFNHLVDIGDVVCPELEDIQEEILELAVGVKSKL